MRILCRKSKRRRVLVMHLVNVLVQHARVQRLMCCIRTGELTGKSTRGDHTPKVAKVLKDKEERDLRYHRLPRRERHLMHG